MKSMHRLLDVSSELHLKRFSYLFNWRRTSFVLSKKTVEHFFSFRILVSLLGDW